jgi:xanthosine utilization system XapX-like protein
MTSKAAAGVPVLAEAGEIGVLVGKVVVFVLQVLRRKVQVSFVKAGITCLMMNVLVHR